MRNAATPEGLQAALAEAHADIAKMQAAVRRTNARMAALTEENEKLRKERDNYKKQLEDAKEIYETELREVTEEMAAAARFTEKEWREHCDGVEAEGQRLRGVIADVAATALELVPGAEAAARHLLLSEEAAARSEQARGEKSAVCLLPPRERYRATVARAAAADETTERAESANDTAEEQLHCLCHALGCTRAELHGQFLGKATAAGRGRWPDTSAPSRGLWELYLALCDVGFPTAAAIAKLLEREETECLLFNAAGHDPEYGDYNYAIPPTAAYDFSHQLLRHLPHLDALCFSHLPPLSTPQAGPHLLRAAPALKELHLPHTSYTVADLLALRRRCPRLQAVLVHASRCTDWGEYAAFPSLDDRKAQVDEACEGILLWED